MENFACERFSFRTSSAKLLKTLLFSRQRNFRFRGSNVIKGLRPILFRAFSPRRFSVVGRTSVTEFSLPNNSRYHRFSFLENQIPNHVTSLIVMPCRPWIRGQSPDQVRGRE